MGCCPVFWQAVWEWLGWVKKNPEPKRENSPRTFVMPSFEEQPVYAFEDRHWATASTYSLSPVTASESASDRTLSPEPPDHENYYDAGALSSSKDPRRLVEYSYSPPDAVIYIPSLTPSPVNVLPPAGEGFEVREWVDVGGWWVEGVDTPSPPPLTDIASSPLDV